MLAEFKAAKDRSKGEILHCKLIFKKRLFRESDEAVADPMFLQLSYVQVYVSLTTDQLPEVGRFFLILLSSFELIVFSFSGSCNMIIF